MKDRTEFATNLAEQLVTASFGYEHDVVLAIPARMSRRRTDIDRLWYSSDIKSSFGLGSSSHKEDFAPRTLQAIQVALVESVTYLEDSVICLSYAS